MRSRKYKQYQFRVVETWLGPVAYVAYADRLVRVYLPCHRSCQIDAMLKEFPCPRENDRLLASFADQLAEYFAGRLMRFSVQVDMRVTDFSRLVLSETENIPFGTTTSYKQLAERIGRATAYRAVGQALASNPVPLVIPCHRVIAGNGTLGGFSCGVDTKRRLLEHEKVVIRR